MLRSGGARRAIESVGAELWRKFFQVLIVGAILVAGYALVRQTIDRLDEFGISSGFGFLLERAGFKIGEALPLPELEGGFVLFMASVFGGVLAVHLFSRWAAARGRTLLGDDRLLALALLLVIGLPGGVLYFAGGTIHVTEFSEDDSLGWALVNGAVNTLYVSAFGLVLSTVLGVAVAAMRLSGNWLAARLGGAYVELIRNLPLLLHLFFWYFAVVGVLPRVRQSINLFDVVFINQRGIFLPRLAWQPGYGDFLVAVAIALGIAFILIRRSRRCKEVTGRGVPALWGWSAAVLVALPGVVWLTQGAPALWVYPTFQGFNFRDAFVLTPEFATLVLALSIYHGSYNAEIVRSGIQSIPSGQKEAALALGLKGGTIFWHVIMPHTIRVIIPPMTNRYLNLIRGSSLGVAVGYEELVSIGNSVNYNTSQVIEVITLTMAFYLITSLIISLVMGRYNARLRRAM